MSKLKKLSFVLIFGLTLVAGLLGLNLSPIKIKTVEAENEKVELVVKKVQYPNIATSSKEDGEATTTPATTKKLGEYTPKELASNYDKIIANKAVDVLSGEVVSINKKNNEAVLVYLRSVDGVAFIRTLNANVVLKSEGKNITFTLDTHSISDSSENRVAIAAFDFSNITKSISSLTDEFEYNQSAHFELTFQYQYSTGTDTVSDSKIFDFYMIDENDYFSSDNIFETNYVTPSEDNITFFHNKQTYEKNPTLTYNPFKFSPTIVYSYNETSATIETQTEYNSLLGTYKFTLISSNQNIFENKTLVLDEYNKINLELDRVGKYTISYNLVINEDENLTIIDSEKTQNIEKLNAQTLYLFGYEALYKNYQETNQEIINLNQNYKRLFNEKYKSDFSFEVAMQDFSTPETDATEIFNDKIDYIETKISSLDVTQIATTNQAPVKLNGYVSENLSGAKYYIVEKNATSSKYKIDTSKSGDFTPSKRFETDGFYCVIIPYKFSNLSEKTYFSVMLFKIENDTPQISFYNDTNETFDADAELLNANGFTNQNVFVVWNNEDNLSPFSYPSNIKFVKGDKILTEKVDYEIKTSDAKKYVVFKENGEYLVQLTYGTKQTTIEKKFTIDNSDIEFEIVETNKNDNKEYEIKNNIALDESNKATTANDFAIFVKNKGIKSNTISVKYDYISLDSVTSQKQFEIVDENGTNKLLIYNNYRLSDLVSNLTYSNITLNNLESFDNLEISNTNSTAVISINALYKFTISDLAGNTKTFFILRDNTENVVLESNSLVEIGTADKDKDGNVLASSKTSLIEKDTNKEAVLNVKDTNVNLVSNNYSMIFGDYKALEFKVTSENFDFAKEYFNLTESKPASNESFFKSITIKNDNLAVSQEILSGHTEENLPTASTVDEAKENHNIFTINVNENTAEIDYIYTLSLSNGTKREFELNTDRNQILIFGKDETGAYTRVYRNSPTKLDEVYITFKNDVNGDDYDLESLILEFYPFTTTKDNEKITFADSKETYDLLSSSTSGQIVVSGTSYGSYVSSALFLTFENGKYVSREGKYVITKTYKNNKKSLQTFYVDRKNPISYFNDDILIGSNIDISLDGKNLSAEKIYDLILNNTSLKTNMLNFAWNITIENGEKGYVYKYPDIAGDKSNLQLNFALFNSTSTFISQNTTLKSGDYTLFIYDNTYRFTNNPTQNEIKNNTNYAEIQISVNTDKPSGYFIKESGETVTGSTNSNKLSFVFEENESEFMYKPDLNNIVLKRNGTVIFKTTTDSSVKTGTFTLSDSKNTTQVHYISTVGNVFSLTREQINSVYRYTLTILDPTKDSIMFENGKSLEALFNLEISYANSNNIELKNEKGEYFGSSNFEIKIDHTAPNSNFLKYLENDKLLSTEQKENLKQSFINKDVSSEINFDNYVFITSVVPKFLDKTDTDMIYIRYYNKYSNSNIENQQSLVSGDPRFDDQTITSKYRFDINTYVDGNKLYTPKDYNNDSSKSENSSVSPEVFFFNGEGFYEIIEVDEAGNYSIYTVYYAKNPTLSALYTLSTTPTGETEQTQSDLTQITDPEFKLTEINSKLETTTESEIKNIDFDYLKVVISINENAENGLTQTLIYLPFSVSNTIYATYFTTQESLINSVNEIIKNYNSLNEYGNVCKISISNRLGTTIIIENSTPNKEFEIKDYIKNYDNNKIVITIPNTINNATYIKTLKVYPVIDGAKDNNPLKIDSNKTNIPTTLEQNQSYIFTFTDTAYISSTSSKTVNIYYFEWEDNFGRIQTTVRHLGEKSESKFTLKDNAQFVTKNGEKYTQNTSNIFFKYSPNLYSIKLEYQLLPSNQKLTIDPSTNDTIETAINSGNFDVFDMFKNHTSDTTSEFNYQIKFIITLTDLTKIGEEQNTETFTYIYYPLMPTFEFSDSSSNILGIKANDNNTISTSKNVHLSYVNNTLFNISNIVVTRTYVDSKNQEISEKFNITKNEYTFSEIGNYEIEVTNELGRTETYKFNITTKTNKTYSVETNEENMTNFELSSCGTIEVETVSYELYMTIFKAKVVVNSDFNLSLKQVNITTEGYENYSFYEIKKNASEDVYKRIAIKKVNYNSNFLNFGNNNDCALKINNTFKTDLMASIKNFTITSTKGLTISLPTYNEDEKNKISIKLYFNNNLIDLNANIYEIVEQTQTLTLDNVPSGSYSLYFEDIAGNTQLFNGNSFLNITIAKEVAVKINDEIPVDYQVYNSTIKLSIVNEKQYIQSSGNALKVEVYKNNKKIEKLVKDENKNYIFSDYGFYKVTITGHISSSEEITKTLYFTILNPNEALKEYSFMSLNGQNITKIMRDGKDVTTELKRILALSPVYGELDTDGNTIYNAAETDSLKNLVKQLQNSDADFEKSYLYNLILKSEIDYVSGFADENDNEITNFNDIEDLTTLKQIIEKYDASGNYEIFVTTQNLILGSSTYSFKLWIRDADAKININSTLENGGTTSKAIKLSFNPYLIYTQIGECNVLVGNNIIAQINSESENAVIDYTITRDMTGTFIVQVKSSNGNTELSLVLNKTEPLSTVSIILIVLASVVVAGGIFLFIKLRTRMKVK